MLRVSLVDFDPREAETAFASHSALPRSPNTSNRTSEVEVEEGFADHPSSVFAEHPLLPRSPRSSGSGVAVSDNPSTVKKVLRQKEARRAAEEEIRLRQLTKARVELYSLRKRLLACDKWVEATCLLRSNLNTEQAFEQARTTVRSSLSFLDTLGQIATDNAEQLQGGTGTIFQQLLQDLAMCGVSGMMIDNLGASGSDRSFEDATSDSEFAGGLGCKDQWPLLLRQTQDVRCIVRIKLQDANDLKAAQYALECCSTCFQEISGHARKRQVSNFSMVAVLEEEEEE
ncbi:hypothetical protein T492DRAFT_926468 [Pavlovales sp. CCMP2436]|nr:hypothetical protein T492DRAFT_926468 [Pavlovales sp. CCMP2436]